MTQVQNDLASIYSPQCIDKLLPAIGKQGDQARIFLNTILINKADAFTLALRMKKRYAQLVVDAYPGIVELHPYCQGALLSLVINRGNSLNHSTNDSRKEMKQISNDLIAARPGNIPDRLRSMKRLWEGKPGLAGLITRREN